MAKRLLFGVMLTVTGVSIRGISDCPEEFHLDQNEMLAPCSKLCKQNMPVWEIRNCRTHCPETFQCLKKLESVQHESATTRPSASTPNPSNTTPVTTPVNVAESVQRENVGSSMINIAIILSVAACVIILGVVVCLVLYRRRCRLRKGEERPDTTSRPSDRPHGSNLCGCARTVTVAPEDVRMPLTAENSSNDKTVCAPSGQKLPEQMETLV